VVQLTLEPTVKQMAEPTIALTSVAQMTELMTGPGAQPKVGTEVELIV